MSSLEDKDEPNSLALTPALPLTVPPTIPRISPDLLQKLMELEKSRKAQSDESKMLMPPPNATGWETQTLDTETKDSRSQSLTGVSGPLPPSLVRGNIRSRSARSLQSGKTKGIGIVPSNQARSQPSSPTQRRKALPDRSGTVG